MGSDPSTPLRVMEDGRWKMEDGRWRMEDGGWKIEEISHPLGQGKGNFRMEVSRIRKLTI